MSKISLIEYGSRLWTYAASTEAEPGHYSLSVRHSARLSFRSQWRSFRQKKSTAHASGLTRRQPKLSPAISSLSARLSFRSQWRSFRQKKSTAHASGLTRRQPKLSPAKFSRLRPAFFSLAMAFLSSEKGLGNILKKNSKSAALGHGLTRRQPKLSPAISSFSVRHSARLHFARNGVPFVRNELGLGLGK
jgi:hypothetical protein